VFWTQDPLAKQHIKEGIAYRLGDRYTGLFYTVALVTVAVRRIGVFGEPMPSEEEEANDDDDEEEEEEEEKGIVGATMRMTISTMKRMDTMRKSMKDVMNRTGGEGAAVAGRRVHGDVTAVWRGILAMHVMILGIVFGGYTHI
jgi:hypothetical protein